jgi:hypothetical protein
MIRDPNNTAARIARKLARFRRAGLEPVCADCLGTDLEFLELDHRYGQEKMSMRREPDPDKRTAMYLRNLAISREKEAPILRQIADEIEHRRKRSFCGRNDTSSCTHGKSAATQSQKTRKG